VNRVQQGSGNTSGFRSEIRPEARGECTKKGQQIDSRSGVLLPVSPRGGAVRKGNGRESESRRDEAFRSASSGVER
jgi:hypothetical protein